MLPPTSKLPPIKYIGTFPSETLNESLEYLQKIYNPPVRGSRRRRHSDPFRREALDAEFDSLRTDSFERNYSIKWLTAVISLCDGFEAVEASSKRDFLDTKEHLIQKAASLLAVCAGTASAGLITRRFAFDTTFGSEFPHEDPTEIQVELRDVPLDNQDYGSVGAQTWGGACIMAEMIAEDPKRFGFSHPDAPPYTTPNHLESSELLRCLELGAGTGLVSLAIAKLVERKPDMKIEIVATDYYPSVLQNLVENIRSNFPQKGLCAHRISTAFLDWSIFPQQEDPDIESALRAPFDLVFGADIIYEAEHAIWIKQCLSKLLRKPHSPDEGPTFHLIIPLRATHTVESNTIEQVFPHYQHTSRSNDAFELVIKSKQMIICDAESGKQGEEVEYAYYTIAWGSGA